MEKYDLLIDGVKKYELLYDYNNPNYRDQLARQEAWNDIGRQLRVSGKFYINLFFVFIFKL